MIPPKEKIPEYEEYEDDDEIAITIPENEDATDASESENVNFLIHCLRGS